MKSTILKSIKAVALTLVLTVGASGLVFANGAGAPVGAKTAHNGGGNGAGGGTSRKRKHKRVARRHSKPKSKTA